MVLRCRKQEVGVRLKSFVRSRLNLVLEAGDVATWHVMISAEIQRRRRSQSGAFAASEARRF